MSLPTPEEVEEEMRLAVEAFQIRYFSETYFPEKFPKLWEILRKYADGEIDELPYL